MERGEKEGGKSIIFGGVGGAVGYNIVRGGGFERSQGGKWSDKDFKTGEECRVYIWLQNLLLLICVEESKEILFFFEYRLVRYVV